MKTLSVLNILGLLVLPFVLVSCTLESELMDLYTKSASSLAWDEKALQSSGNLQATWTPPTTDKAVQQELLYFKGANCEDPILPSLQLSAKDGINIANFSKEEGENYTYRVFTMDNTGAVTPSSCSSPITYVDNFSVATVGNGRVNEANVTAVPFQGRCAKDSVVQVSAPSVANVTSFTCASTGDWSRLLDLSAVSGVYTGDLTFTVTPAGGSPKTYTVAIEKDTVPPTVNINAVAAIGAANQTAYTVSGTCSENGSVVSLIVGTVNGSATCTAGAFSTTLDLTSLTGNTITISATHKDSFDNTRSKFVITTRNVTVPTITSVALNSGAAITNSLSATLNMNVSGATEMYVTNIAGCTAGGTWETYAASKAWTLLSANATNTVYVKFKESHGNETACVSDDIVHDNINPTVTLDSPLAGSPVNSSNVTAFTIGGTCSENGRSITITGPSGFTSTTVCSGSAFSAILDLSSLAQGSFQLGASINDAAGNTGAATSPSYTKDTTAPTGSLSINSDNPSTTSLAVTLTLSSSDAGGEMYVTNTAGCGANGVWESFAASKAWTLATADATNTVYVKYKDTAGNVSSCYSDSIDHASTTPSVTLASPASGSYINIANSTAFTVSGACSENGNAVNITVTGLSAQSATCSAGAWSKTLDLSSLADGSISFTINHSRSAGLDATPASQSYTKDTVAPSITSFVIQNDAAYTSNLNTWVNIAATSATDMYITNNALCLTGGTWESYATTQLWTLTTANSLNTVYFKTRDTAGNESNCVSDTITHDGSVPNLTWSTPTNLSYINNNNKTSFTMTGTCNLNGRTVDTYVYWGATPQAPTGTATCTSNTWSITMDMSGLADQAGTPYSVFARLTALNGNTSSPTRNFYKDTVNPGAATITGAPTGTNSTSTLNITVAGTGIVQYRYFIVPPGGTEVCTNTAAYTGSDIPVATKITDSLTATGDGAYKVCVLGRETSGNYSTTTTQATWTRDATGPVPTLVSSTTADGTYGAGSTINVRVTFNEAVYVATASPSLTLETGTTDRTATYSSGSGTTVLVFNYTVQTDDSSADLDYTTAALISLNGGTLKDTYGNNATLSLPAAGSANSLAGQKNIVINAPQPVAVLTGAPTGTYTGSSLNVTVSGTAVTQFKRAIITSGTCASATYGTAVAIASAITNSLTGYPNGPITLCVLGGDAAGTFQPAASATSATWIKDSMSSVTISSTKMNRVMEGSGSQNITVSISPAKSYDVVASYHVTGDATYPAQHNLVDGTVTIPAGATSVNIPVNFPDNSDITGERVMTLNLSTLDTTMATIGASYQAQFYIADDEKNLTINKLSIGRKHSCAVMSDNSLRCWGLNAYGQIGDGTSMFRSEGVTIASGTSFKAVSVGNEHSCAIATNGDLYCWGRNANGQVGNNGAGVDKNTPQLIDSGVAYQMVSSGENHSCGLTTTNKIRCWGQGMYGALGNGGTSNLNVPTEIDAAVDYKFVSVGAKSSCAITSTDKLRCWGHNAVNELGDGTTTNALAPIDIDATNDYATVAIGSGHGCGVTLTGAMRCWGYNGTGAIGDGTTTARTTPVTVNSGTTYTAVAVTDDQNIGGGRTTTCAVLSTGAVQCWGSNVNGQLANSTLTQSTSAVNVDAGTTYSSIFVTGHRACGVTTGTAGGALKCWGNFGYDSTKTLNIWGGGYAPHQGSWNKWFTNYELAKWDEWTPALNSTTENASQTCGLKSGKLWCWGSAGVFGDGTTSAVRRPAAMAIDPNTTYTAIANVHDQDVCAIDSAGNLKCWGKNDYGELGAAVAVGSTAYVPTNVDPGTTYKKVSVAYNTICAITTADELRCAGNGNNYLMGNGSTNSLTAFTTVDSGVTYAEVGRGFYHTCARTTAGVIKCWGANGFGQVGNGGTTSQATPYIIDGGATFKKLIVGSSANCGITTSDTVRCWGDPTNGTGGYAYSPATLDGGATYAEIALGYSNGCGIKFDGTMKCWGYATVSNLSSVVEGGSHAVFNTPSQVAGGATFSKVQLGQSYICGTTTAGSIICSGRSTGDEWGFADSGVDPVISNGSYNYYGPSFLHRAINY
ncbi:MAG: hypothetical protein J7501_09505 [Bdellovibrio sp.]|nr:hypothetical protein [Bdellovibrio sp.]